MSPLVIIINQVSSLFTALGWLIFLVLIIAIFARKKNKNAAMILDFTAKRAILLSFGIAFVSLVVSLFYSDIIGFEPCKLCWFQRIFMYPQVFIFGLALLRKDEKVADYGILLSAVGAIIAGYHYLLQYGLVQSTFCLSKSAAESCSQRVVIGLDYITIPFMALTAFSLIIVFLKILKIRAKDR